MELEQELNRIKARSRGLTVLQILAVILVSGILLGLLIVQMPTVRITGNSMSPTLSDGDIVITLKNVCLKRGDVCVFYSEGRLLCKRVIGLAGDVIEMDAGGNVYVNGELLAEPYLAKKVLGYCDITFPYTVPSNSFFLMGDNRDPSQDSCAAQVGTVPENQILGKLLFRIWPFGGFGSVT